MKTLLMAATTFILASHALAQSPFSIFESGNVSAANSTASDTGTAGWGYRFSFTSGTGTTAVPYLIVGKTYLEQAIPAKLLVKFRSPLWVDGITRVVAILDRGGIGDTARVAQYTVYVWPSSEWTEGAFTFALSTSSFSRLRFSLTFVPGDSGTRTIFADDIRTVSSLGDTVSLDDGGALPVQLTMFSTSMDGMAVVLTWRTATEVNNYGFEIERRIIGGLAWHTVGFVQGFGTTTSPRDYAFTDREVSYGRYVYRLKQIDRDGTFAYSGDAEISAGTVPTALTLGNFPNPFNPSTKVQFSVPYDGWVTLKIYDVLGKEAATLVDREMVAGNHEVTFDASGLPTGVYFSRIVAGAVATKKMVLAR
ncbi:MAG: T9SS type A sorting domain-containing protein [Candidatus Brennerbacteria bacterium]